MVLCIEPQKIYSPGSCHEIAFLSTFSHNGPRPKRDIWFKIAKFTSELKIFNCDSNNFKQLLSNSWILRPLEISVIS